MEKLANQFGILSLVGALRSTENGLTSSLAAETGCPYALPVMNSDIASDAFNRGIDPVLELLTPDQARRISDYHSDDSLQARIEWLAGRSAEGILTDDERAEYEGYVRANHFLSVLFDGIRRRFASY